MNVIDKYSIIHFTAGVIMYLLHMHLSVWFMLNTLFEIYENHLNGNGILSNMYVKFWFSSGSPETLINSIGDVVCSSLGWICAFYIDKKIIH